MNIYKFISHQNFVYNAGNSSAYQPHRKLQYHAELPGYAVNKKKARDADYRTFLWQDENHKFAISVGKKGYFLCYHAKDTPLTVTIGEQGEQEVPIVNGAVFIPDDRICGRWGCDGNIHEILHYAKHLMVKPVEVLLRPKYATLNDSNEVAKHYWKIPIIRRDWWSDIDTAILLEWAHIFDEYLNTKVSEDQVLASRPMAQYVLLKSAKTGAYSLLEEIEEGIYEYHYNNQAPKQYEHEFSAGHHVKVHTVGQHWLISLADAGTYTKGNWIAPDDMPVGGLNLGDSIESATEVLNNYATAIKLI